MAHHARTPIAPRTRHRAARLSRVVFVAFVAGTFAALGACSKVAGIDGLEIGECKGGVCAAETGVAEDAPLDEEETGPAPEAGPSFEGGLPCPGPPGPTMVRVGTASNNFCIDSTEVTVGQYREFTDAVAGDAGGQPPECAWNTSYQAGAGGADDIPIAAVDWCDARAFCAWAGKRLCGKHADGKFVGSVGPNDLGDFTTHEWFIACSDLGQLKYPYGSIMSATSCNVGENDAGRTLPVKSKSGCQGGFPGVYDMVGNVWEWFDGPCPPPDAGAGVDAGDAGPAKQQCIVKGAGFPNSGPNLDCRVDGLGASRDTRAAEIGFRCCAD